MKCSYSHFTNTVYTVNTVNTVNTGKVMCKPHQAEASSDADAHPPANNMVGHSWLRYRTEQLRCLTRLKVARSFSHFSFLPDCRKFCSCRSMMIRASHCRLESPDTLNVFRSERFNPYLHGEDRKSQWSVWAF